MQNDLKLAPSGLWTAPSAVKAPPGALQDAMNVVIRRLGVAEPRPGFSEDTTTFPVATLGTLRMLEREAKDGTFDLISVGKHTGTYLVWSGGMELTDLNGTALTKWVADRIWGINTRGNLYLTTATGVRRMSEHPADNHKLQKAGGRTYHVANAGPSGTAGSAILANQWVSYRVCSRHTDKNGVVVRSGVSGRDITFGTSSDKQCTVPIIGQANQFLAEPDIYGDTVYIEVYRSENSLTYPPLDEHFYVGEIAAYTVDTAGAGFASFTDTVADASLGVALYTNALQQGQAANHVTPPAAGCGAMFNGSLFLGNLSYAPSIVLGITVPYGLSQVPSFTGTFTNGSATATTTLTSGTILVDQIVENPSGTSWGGAAHGYTRIASINPGVSVTFTDPWTGANGVHTVLLLDTVKIGTQYFPMTFSQDGGFAQILAASIRGVLAVGYYKSGTTAVDIAATVVTANTIDIDTHGMGYVQIEGFEADQTSARSFAISTTLPASFNPAIPLTTATPLTVTQEDQSNGLIWSNNLEPEHFTGVNEDRIAPVGRIMAMHSLGNSLLVFLDTGLWRVSGSGAESGFRFDQLDQDMRLIFPYAATRLMDMVYAHGDKGIHACDENSATNLTAVNLRDRLQPFQVAAGAGSTAAIGSFALTNRKDDEVLFSVPASTDLNTGASVYVFNANMGAWTQWFSGDASVCGIARSAGALMCFYDSGKGALRVERTTSGTCDKQGTATTAATGASVVLSAVSSGFTVEVGDALRDNATSLVFLVLTVVGSTVTLDRAFSTQGAGSAVLYKSYTSTITPVASMALVQGYDKCWGEGRLLWGSLEGLYQVVMSVTSALSDTAVTQTRVLASSLITRTAPESLRFVVPRNHARTTRVFPSVIIKQALSTWRLEGLDLSYRISSDRVLRKRG